MTPCPHSGQGKARAGLGSQSKEPQSRNQLQSKVRQLEELLEAPELYGHLLEGICPLCGAPGTFRGRISRGILRNDTRHGCTLCVSREEGAEGTTPSPHGANLAKAGGAEGRIDSRSMRGSHLLHLIWKWGQPVSNTHTPLSCPM